MARREVGKAEQLSCVAVRQLPTIGPFKKMNSECHQTSCIYIYFLHQKLAN